MSSGGRPACCRATPAEHIDRLGRHDIEHIVTGDDHVDLATALDLLARRHGIRAVRTDSGGKPNGLLFDGGLVDEVSLILAPRLVGADDPHPVHVIIGRVRADRQRVELTSVMQLRDGHV